MGTGRAWASVSSSQGARDRSHMQSTDTRCGLGTCAYFFLRKSLSLDSPLLVVVLARRTLDPSPKTQAKRTLPFLKAQEVEGDSPGGVSVGGSKL